MKKTMLKFDAAGNSKSHTVIKNNHGRTVYIKISMIDDQYIEIIDAFYIDRP